MVRAFETAKGLVPAPLRYNAETETRHGVIYFGSTSPAMDEAIEENWLLPGGLHLRVVRCGGVVHGRVDGLGRLGGQLHVGRLL